MKISVRNVAYIDGANLYNAARYLGWQLDYQRLRVWLREKYLVETAYLFLGMIPKNKDLYNRLQKQDYTLIFKEVAYDGAGKAKGNCDADIVVQVMQDTYETMFEKAILISSDGDYVPLVKFLITKDKIDCIISPYEPNRCSILLKRSEARIVYLTDHRSILEAPKNKKAPDVDETT